jgi:DNA-binding MarR family transcriptional regulator
MSIDPPGRVRGLPSWLLAQAARRGDQLVTAALRQHGVRKHHYTVLLTLEADGPTSQAELGRRLGIDRSDVHGVITTLAERGLVTRRPDPADPRRNVVTATDAGGALLAELDAAVDAAQDELVAALTPAERQALVRLLGPVAGV